MRNPAGQTVPVNVCICWNPGDAAAVRGRIPTDERLTAVEVSESESQAGESFDLVLSTHVFLYRNGIAALAAFRLHAVFGNALARAGIEQVQDCTAHLAPDR